MTDNIGLITSKYDILSASEKVVADAVIGNMRDMLLMSIQDFSNYAGVSVATTIRFCKKMGFDGYRDFCIQMAQNSNNHVDYVLDLHASDDDMESQIRRVLMANAETIHTTMDNLDYKTIEHVAEVIDRCRRIMFVGMGTSHIVCEDAMLRFLRAGKQALCYGDAHASVVAVSHFDAEDVVVGISHSGTTQEVYEVLRFAKQKGATTVAITTYPQERISEVSDVILRTQTRESPVHKVAITSRTSQSTVIDALFIAVISRDADQSIDNVLRVSSNITNMEGFKYSKRVDKHAEKDED